jgi:transcriptional regulator with XRE-family HTH domain
VLDEIGIKIRRLRESANVSGRELARRVGSAQSYVSKIESGKLRPTRSFCRKVARALALNGRAKAELLNLVSLYRSEHHPLSSAREAVREGQRAIQRLEEECAQIRVFQPILIPGLLQTRRYMTAIFERYTPDPRVLAETVKTRLSRQAVLDDEDRSFKFLIAENVFWSNIGGSDVMREQLKDLVALSARRNVRISVLPNGVPFPIDTKIPMAGFEVLDEGVVIMDTLNGYVTFTHPDIVGEHIVVFDRLEKVAVPQEGIQGFGSVLRAIERYE